MAEKYDEFKKEYAAIEKKIAEGNEELKKWMQWTFQASGIMKECAVDIGARVQELKSKGATGTTIKDFEDDAEVKALLKHLEDFLTRTDQQQKELLTAKNGYIKKAITDFWHLKKEVEAEVQARTKKLAPSSSLASMKKMLVEMNAYKDDKEFLAVGAMNPQGEDYRREAQFNIKEEIAKTKEERVSAQKQELALQAMNTRMLKGNLGQAKTMYDAVLVQCNKVDELRKANKEFAVKAELTKALVAYKPLSEMAKMYKAATEDQWIKAKIAESKDKGTIASAIAAISKLNADAGDAIKAIAS